MQLGVEPKEDKQEAAKVIQKEVRKYLEHLGFYEVFSNQASSDKKSNQQFNVFIDKRGLHEALE